MHLSSQRASTQALFIVIVFPIKKGLGSTAGKGECGTNSERSIEIYIHEIYIYTTMGEIAS